MKKRYSACILTLPTLATLAILFVSLGTPLLACLSEHSTSIGEYLGFVAFPLVTVSLFGVPGYVVVPMSLAGFGIGTWLLLSSASRARSVIVLSIAIVLAMLPIALACLVPTCSKYHGP